MTCRLYEEQLSSYLDGELPAARAARLEAHLRVCPHCREELDAMGGIATRIRAASSELKVSHDFDRRVLRAVGYWQVKGWQRPVRSYLRPLLLAAMFLLAMLGAVWYYFARPPAPEWAPQPAAAVVAPSVPGAPAPGVPDRKQREPE